MSFDGSVLALPSAQPLPKRQFFAHFQVVRTALTYAAILKAEMNANALRCARH